MLKRSQVSACLLALTFLLIACQLAQALAPRTSPANASLTTEIPTNAGLATEIPTNAGLATEIPTVESFITGGIASQTPAPGTVTPGANPSLTPSPGSGTSGPLSTGTPPQARAAGIQPKAMRTQLTHLSPQIGYAVVDENGNRLGIASDFIVNPCETYLIYMLIDPDASLHVASGNRLVIPFEAVTINSGVLDAQNKTILLRLQAAQFNGAPTLASGSALMPTSWEGPVVAFWKQFLRIGVLRTTCGTAGGPTTKIAYASQLLGVKLYDGRESTLLGTVQEAILEPESGQVQFYVVKPADGNGLVLVSIGRTNIPKDAMAPGAALKLVLLADPSAFSSAPRLASMSQVDDLNEQARMRGYWK